MRMFCNVSIRETNYVFFFCLLLSVFVYYIFVFSIINDEFSCEVIQAKVPIRDGTT